MTAFTVDTHLFRELGELLVGRESTALIELLKNAYDADATTVVVYAKYLTEPSRGIIRITDDGIGMDLATFETGFLRIASRMREQGARKSKIFGRRFTGAKGVGRLAAHKLSKRLDIESVPRLGPGRTGTGVTGYIDWIRVEEAEVLSDVAPNAIGAEARSPTKADRSGTTLTLSKLRQKWTKAQLSRFLLEVEALRAPALLCNALPRNVVQPEDLLFETPTVHDGNSSDPGFNVQLEGELEIGDNYWPAVLNATEWVIEIDSSARSVRYRIIPTKQTQRLNPATKLVKLSEPHPDPSVGPFFHARILFREGGGGKRDQRAWSTRMAGIRVYMEGFRVLPYGAEGDDWLSVSRDYSDRTRKLRFLVDSKAADGLEQVDGEGLSFPSNKNFVGAIFLTADRAQSLEMLVNREGFVPSDSFYTLATLVRRGIDLSTRVRAAAKQARKAAEVKEEEAEPALRGPSTPERLRPGTLKGRAEGSLKRLAASASELETMAKNAPGPLAKKLIATVSDIEQAAEATRGIVPANSMVLVLASVGTQLAAFTHEVNALLSLASDVEGVAVKLREAELPAKLRGQVVKVGTAAADLRRALERQAAYLVDIVTPDARRRRSRQRIDEVLNATWRLVANVAEHREIKFKNEVEPERKSPPMFRAELMAIFTNLLTNAVKAAGDGGTIRARASDLSDGGTSVRLENTGVEVDLSDAEKWFKAFESTTVKLDPVLGQGMGMGLGITRDLLAEIGATISFVKPRSGFQTALEIQFPGGAT